MEFVYQDMMNKLGTATENLNQEIVNYFNAMNQGERPDAPALRAALYQSHVVVNQWKGLVNDG